MIHTIKFLTLLILLTGLQAEDEAAKNDPDKAGGTIYISNQSFDIPSIHLTVTLNGKKLADQSFAVNRQHTWISFKATYKMGSNTIRIQTKDGKVVAQTSFKLKKGPMNAVISFWKSEEDETPNGYITFYLSPDQIKFK